jgi:hypothetical protein
MTKIVMGVLMGLFALMMATGVSAATSKAEYQADVARAEADYKVANDRCKSLAGNAKDVCVAEAKGAQKKAKASAEARNKDTDKARQDAQIAAAEADHDVAKARCGAKAGNDKDVCLKEANAALVSAKADAKAHREIKDIRKGVAEDKRDAEYKVALEKCDAMAGASKDACKAEAKARFGKS